MWVKYNANPHDAHVGDCTVRAISKATGKSWDEVYIWLAIVGFCIKDMEDANRVWGEYLRMCGFQRKTILNDCQCYTVEDFCIDHPQGKFVIATEGHVIAMIDGCIYDTWDSSKEIAIYYWEVN